MGDTNVTRAVTAGTYVTGSVPSGDSVLVLMKVTLTAAARPDDRRVFELAAVSAYASTKRDTVAAVARR